MATVEDGASYSLPECTFTPPTDKRFQAWKLGETEYNPGDSVTITTTTTFTAVWMDNIYDIVFEMKPFDEKDNKNTELTTYRPGDMLSLAPVTALGLSLIRIDL
ncbi:MAG: hypothetical protein VZQ83_06935 [Eubacterium sp.]|nr:hypothetical protein [Eubacterium sp.]